MKNFSIIIPTLNEADNIEPLLERIDQITGSLAMEPEIIFIDDDSTDETRLRIANYVGELDVHLIHRRNAHGLTSAVVTGARAATNDWIVVMDADLSHPPEKIPVLLEPLAHGSHDMVIGSRYVEGGGSPGLSIIRNIGSRLASMPARMFTSARDPLAGFFAVNRQRLLAVDSGLTGFKIGLEILAQGGSPLRGLEVPISFEDRRNGSSKMNYTILKEYFRQLLRFASRHPLGRHLPLFAALGILAGLLDCLSFTLAAAHGSPLETSHIFSLLFSVHCVYGCLLLLERRKIIAAAHTSYYSFLLAVLLGLWIRGGLLALPWLPQTTAAATVMLAATSWTIWMAAIISSVSGILQFNRATNWKIFGSLLIGYTILLHLVYLGSPELLQEEAYYWNYSQHMAAGYLDHPPIVALLIHFGTLLFGNNEFGVRIGGFCCWFITAFFTYRLAKVLFSAATAFRATVLVAVLPIFFGVALVSTPDAPLFACWSGALYYLYRALVQQHTNSWYGAGIFLGLGLASKYTIAFLGPAVVLFMVLDPSARKWFLKPQPYLAALLALSFFSPVIWWNFENGWASFLFQSQGRLQAQAVFSTHILLASILILLTPIGFIAAISAMFPKRRQAGGPDAVIPGDSNRVGYLYCLFMAGVPLLIFLLFSFSKEVKLNWTGPIWLSILPFIASSMTRQDSLLQQRLARIWPATLVSLVLCYGIVLHYCALGLPGVSYGKNPFLFGWDDLARQVEEKVQTITAKDGKRPLVVGMDPYRIASGLAFYRQKETTDGSDKYIVSETTGSHLFGWNDLMYSYWYIASEAIDRDILLVSRDKNRLDPAYFRDHYQHLGQIHELDIEKRGKNAGRYYYRLLNGYSLRKQEALAEENVSGRTRKIEKNGAGERS